MEYFYEYKSLPRVADVCVFALKRISTGAKTYDAVWSKLYVKKKGEKEKANTTDSCIASNVQYNVVKEYYLVDFDSDFQNRWCLYELKKKSRIWQLSNAAFYIITIK